MNVLALVEEDETNRALKTIKTFKPFKGDLLQVEYSTNPGTSKINIHSVSHLNSQYMEEASGLCFWEGVFAIEELGVDGCSCEENRQAFAKDGNKSPPIEAVEDMRDKIHSRLDKFGDNVNNCLLEKRRIQMYSQMNTKRVFKYVLSDNTPLKIGTNVLALVEENKRAHILKAIKVKGMNALPEGSEPSKLGRRLCIRCVTSVTEEDVYISKEKCFPLYMFSGAFKPFKGDLLLIEYSINPGTSKINIHSVSPLNSQVCITSIDGRNGVVDDIVFFTLDYLHTPPGYTPSLYYIVNVLAVDSFQPYCSYRAVSMTPVEMVY
ncbi:RNA helicase Mov10l1 [Apodemus speciosus]|uniref:RNA helicase Mov10l1 n=1 Tax=Apodemus speciosus TaxID=105296 RepID=A0ABQ0FU62_APOSI